MGEMHVDTLNCVPYFRIRAPPLKIFRSHPKNDCAYPARGRKILFPRCTIHPLPGGRSGLLGEDMPQELLMALNLRKHAGGADPEGKRFPLFVAVASREGVLGESYIWGRRNTF